MPFFYQPSPPIFIFYHNLQCSPYHSHFGGVHTSILVFQHSCIYLPLLFTIWSSKWARQLLCQVNRSGISQAIPWLTMGSHHWETRRGHPVYWHPSVHSWVWLKPIMCCHCTGMVRLETEFDISQVILFINLLQFICTLDIYVLDISWVCVQFVILCMIAKRQFIYKESSKVQKT